MDAEKINWFFLNYGGIAVFVIVFLEYLNLPGFPAGIIMPLAGIWAAKGNIGFGSTLLISVAAGLLGSWMLYGLGRVGGSVFLKCYLRHFPKHEAAISRNFEILRRKGFWGIIVGKLIPMLRTLISIPAGVMEMDFLKYTISSTMGIAVWNFFFVGAGYLFGERILSIFL